MILKQRRKHKMEIKFCNKKMNIEAKKTVSEAFEEQIKNSEYDVIGCLYNNEYRNLETEIERDADIKLIDVSSKEGMKISVPYVTAQKILVRFNIRHPVFHKRDI